MCPPLQQEWEALLLHESNLQKAKLFLSPHLRVQNGDGFESQRKICSFTSYISHFIVQIKGQQTSSEPDGKDFRLLQDRWSLKTQLCLQHESSHPHVPRGVQLYANKTLHTEKAGPISWRSVVCQPWFISLSEFVRILSAVMVEKLLHRAAF